MINAFIKTFVGYNHIVDCVAELTRARKEGNKVKIMCLERLFELYKKNKIKYWWLRSGGNDWIWRNKK